MPPEVAEHTTFFKVNWSDVERQLILMDKHGIGKALLVYPTSDAHLQMGGWGRLCGLYNAAIAQVVRKYSQRFIGAGILPVDNPGKFEEELKRLEDLGLRVISLASSYEGVYLDAQVFSPVYEFAQKRKIPIHVHPQIMNPIGESRVKDPLLSPVLEYVFDVSMCIGKMMMSGTFLKFPDVSFIFSHYGGVLPFVRERFDNTYLMLRKREFVQDLLKLPSEYFKNLYFDTSGSGSPASLLCMLEMVEASRIIFGSDYPANQNFSSSLSSVENAAIPDDDKRRILDNDLLKAL